MGNLALSRTPKQAVILDVPPAHVARRIRVTVVKVQGDRVQIAFEAPSDIRIAREEIHKMPPPEEVPNE